MKEFREQTTHKTNYVTITNPVAVDIFNNFHQIQKEIFERESFSKLTRNVNTQKTALPLYNKSSSVQ